jgi:hypothetical protein
MSDNNIEKDPLLGGNQTPPDEPGKVETPKQPEAKPVTPKAPKVPKDKLKAEAVKLFPNDVVAQTKFILDNSPHVNFIVPQLEGEIGIEEVQTNGYKLTIQKNVMVSIPIQIAQRIAEKYKINMEAGKDKRIDRDKDVSEALN